MKYILFVFLIIQHLSCIAQSTGQDILQQAIELQEKGSYQEALPLLEKATKAFEQEQKTEDYLNAKSKISYNYLKTNFLEQAIRNSNACIEEATRLSSRAPYWEAVHQKIIAEAYLSLGKYEVCKDILKKNIQNIQGVGQPEMLAENYSLLGIVYWQEGNNNLALEYLEKGLEVRKANNSTEISASYNDLGLVYQGIDVEKSLGFYQKALEIYQTRLPAIHPKNAVLFTNLGILEKNMKKYTEAQKYLEKARSIWKSLYPEGHPNEAFVISNIGRLLLEKKDFEKSNEAFEQALQIYLKTYSNKHPEVANTYNLLATSYLRNNQTKQALEHIQKALISNSNRFEDTDIGKSPSANDYLSHTTFLYSLMLKADALEQLYTTKSIKIKDLKSAIQNIQIADTLLNRVRQNATSKADKLLLGQISAELYEKGIRICYLLAQESQQKKKYYTQAFYFSEKAKAIVLLESISESKAKSFGNIPQPLLEEENNIKVEITFLEQQIAQRPAEHILQEYKSRLFELNRRYEALQQKLEKEYPEYYNLKYSSQVVSVESLQNKLDNQTVILSYVLGEQYTYILMITRKNIQIYRFQKPEDLEGDITLILNAIKFSNFKLFTKAAYKLYKDIFPRNLPKHITNVVIVQDGRLSTLPIEVLIDKPFVSKNSSSDFSSLAYLIKKRSFSYSYSATLWHQNLGKSGNQQQNIALIAPINFGDDVSALPGTEKEINEIAGICRLKKFKVNALLKQEAQKQVLKSLNLKDFSVLHFATHGFVDETSPELSQVFLFKNEQEDGNLFAGEIYNLRLDADLVTLSACEVGLGTVSKGEGLIGLSRAFLYAGAKNLVVSLWKVSDESTARLMIYFYTNHLGNPNTTYAQAMRVAKNQLIQDKQYAKPYYWAAFIVLGR
jgi:CHAT domain-containing protein/Tfp pilus assembly protein PilF